MKTARVPSSNGTISSRERPFDKQPKEKNVYVPIALGALVSVAALYTVYRYSQSIPSFENNVGSSQNHQEQFIRGAPEETDPSALDRTDHSFLSFSEEGSELKNQTAPLFQHLDSASQNQQIRNESKEMDLGYENGSDKEAWVSYRKRLFLPVVATVGGGILFALFTNRVAILKYSSKYFLREIKERPFDERPFTAVEA